MHGIALGDIKAGGAKPPKAVAKEFVAAGAGKPQTKLPQPSTPACSPRSRTSMNTAEVMELLEELAIDLAAELDARHRFRDCYPVIMRDYERDMVPVRRAQAMLKRFKDAEVAD